MGQDHSHDHSHQHAEGNIKTAFFLNLAFTFIEIVGGIYTNSLAILSDAVHDLGDSLSLGLSWYFQKLSKKGRTNTFSYGYKRFSLLGALINAIVLLTGSILILIHAIPQLLHPESTDAQGMMFLAILGVIVNGLAVLKLRNGKTINEKVVSLHMLEDVMGWVAVLLGSLIMQIWDLPIIDPLLSILISSWVLWNVIKNLKKSLLVLLQGIPEEVNMEGIHQKLEAFPEIIEVHDCHIWSMDGDYNVLTVHLRLTENYTLTQQAKLKSKFRKVIAHESIDHITLEFEGKDEACEFEDC